MRWVMRPLLGTLLGLVGLLAYAPAAQAAVELYEDHSFAQVDEVAIRLEARFLEEDAARLRQWADHDRDAEVTDAESTVHLGLLRHEHLDALGARLRLNADEPALVTNLTVGVVGLQGAVSRTDAVVFTGAALVQFDVPQVLGDHVYVMRPTTAPAHVRVHLPEGSQLQTVAGLGTTDHQAGQEAVSGTLGDSDAVVMFRQSTWAASDGAAAAPGVWTWLSVAAVGASAAARRFR